MGKPQKTLALPSSELERRIYDALKRAVDSGVALSTRQIAARAFHPRGTSGAEIVATRQALRALECRGFTRRIVQGQRPGESVWTYVPVYLIEWANGRREFHSPVRF